MGKADADSKKMVAFDDKIVGRTIDPEQGKVEILSVGDGHKVKCQEKGIVPLAVGNVVTVIPSPHHPQITFEGEEGCIVINGESVLAVEEV